MKKFFITLLAVVTSFSYAMADDTYKYLVFTDTGGRQTALEVEDLEMNISDGNLLATNSAGSATLSLKSLASMEFSNEVPETAVNSPVEFRAQSVSVFTTSGILAGKFDSLATALKTLPKGIYLFKIGTQTNKMMVR